MRCNSVTYSSPSRNIPWQLVGPDTTVIQFMDSISNYLMPWRIPLRQFVVCDIKLYHEAPRMF